MQNVIPPPFFLSSPGEPSIIWSKWKKVFLHYVHVCGTSFTAERKTLLLLHCLRSEGNEVFEHLPDLADDKSDDLN